VVRFKLCALQPVIASKARNLVFAASDMSGGGGKNQDPSLCSDDKLFGSYII